MITDLVTLCEIKRLDFLRWEFFGGNPNKCSLEHCEVVAHGKFDGRTVCYFLRADLGKPDGFGIGGLNCICPQTLLRLEQHAHQTRSSRRPTPNDWNRMASFAAFWRSRSNILSDNHYDVSFVFNADFVLPHETSITWFRDARRMKFVRQSIALVSTLHPLSNPGREILGHSVVGKGASHCRVFWLRAGEDGFGEPSGIDCIDPRSVLAGVPSETPYFRWWKPRATEADTQATQAVADHWRSNTADVRHRGDLLRASILKRKRRK